jgi:hypothetical protein
VVDRAEAAADGAARAVEVIAVGAVEDMAEAVVATVRIKVRIQKKARRGRAFFALGQPKSFQKYRGSPRIT